MSAPDIFLSYNREDQAVAKRFADAFAAEGLNVWWDTALRSGETYDEVTEAALRGAKAVVVLWSPRSVVSRWVRAEATIADRCKTLVPVTIEPCERPIMFELTQTADLSHWTEDLMDKAWLGLLDDVRRIVGRVAQVPAAELDALRPRLASRGERGAAPSLAVLPFTNRSGLSEDDVFATGMVEDLIDALSQAVHCRVLSSSATARMRSGALPDPADLGRQLDVRYFLEGNVRRSENEIRVTAQLVDAISGDILWTKKFNRPLDRLADLQEALVGEVATQMGARVYQHELERVLQKPSDHTAWEAAMRSLSHFRNNQVDIAAAVAEAEHAIELAPDYGLAHAMLAHALGIAHMYLNPVDDPAQNARVIEHAETAVRLAANHALTAVFAGQAYCYAGRPQEGLHWARRGLKESALVVEGHYTCGLALLMLNRWDEAVAQFEADVATTPGNFVEYSSMAFCALAHSAAGRFEAAVAAADRSQEANPDNPVTNMLLAATLQLAGERARALDLFLRFWPAWSALNLPQPEVVFHRLLRGAPFEVELIKQAGWLQSAAEGS